MIVRLGCVLTSDAAVEDPTLPVPPMMSSFLPLPTSGETSIEGGASALALLAWHLVWQSLHCPLILTLCERLLIALGLLKAL